MKNLFYRVVFFVFFISLFSSIFSQVEPDSINQEKKVLVKMSNGDEYIGKVLSQASNSLTLKTENGELNLIVSNIKSIEAYTYTGKFKFMNPHNTRYFFGPSAIPIKKGRGYYQNILVTTNFVNYGITKNFSVGGGLEFMSTINGNPIWFLTPKLGFKVNEKVHAGGGFIMAGFATAGAVTLGYGVITLGSGESNISGGIGYGLVNGDFSSSPALMISGTHRVSNSIALLTENYIIPGDLYFGIHGIRILSKKNSFDIGAIIIPEFAYFVPALPFIGYVREF